MTSEATQWHLQKTEVVTVFIDCFTSKFVSLEKTGLLYRKMNYISLCLERSHSKLNLTVGLRGIASFGQRQTDKPWWFSPSVFLWVFFFFFVNFFFSGNDGTVFLRDLLLAGISKLCSSFHFSELRVPHLPWAGSWLLRVPPWGLSSPVLRPQPIHFPFLNFRCHNSMSGELD